MPTMKHKRTMANHSFQQLEGSAEFLNIVLNNITSCVLLLDEHMRIQAFNDALTTIFSNKADEDLLYMHCGEAIGCAYQIDEAKECGKTSQCCSCELRVAAMQSYMNEEVIYKSKIKRPFYTKDYQLVEKTLQFSTRLFKYKRDKYIILIVEDITPLTINTY